MWSEFSAGSIHDHWDVMVGVFSFNLYGKSGGWTAGRCVHRVTSQLSGSSAPLATMCSSRFLSSANLTLWLLLKALNFSNELCHLAANLHALSLVCQSVHIPGKTFRHFLDGSSAPFKLFQVLVSGPSFLALCLRFLLSSPILKMDSILNQSCSVRGPWQNPM